MVQKLNKRKPAPQTRAAAPRRTTKRQNDRGDEAEVAVATLLALLHADRWLFEASELARKGNLVGETEQFDAIRLAIVESLHRLQPRAYGAMTRSGFMGIGQR